MTTYAPSISGTTATAIITGTFLSGPSSIAHPRPLNPAR